MVRGFQKEEALSEEQLNEQLNKIYANQEDSLKQLLLHPGMEHIRAFFQREKKTCEDVFKAGVKPDYSSFMQGKYQIVSKFLDFLAR